MPLLVYPNIAANLFDPNDICASCGSNLKAVDRVDKKLATACLNKSCQRHQCSCVSDLKEGKESVKCSIHWKCDCRQGYICGSHRLKPELVKKRYRLKGNDWCGFSGFTNIYNQAEIWMQACAEREKKALAHCGNCFSVLAKEINKAGERICPKGCHCECGTSKPCHVHLKCGCIDSFEICQFHKTKKPEVIVAIYKSLPAIKIRPKLGIKLDRAGIDITKYPRRGRQLRELDIRELARSSKLAVRTSVQNRVPSVPEKITSKPRVQQPPQQKASVPIIKMASQSLKESKEKFDLASDLAWKILEYKIWLGKQGLSIHSTRNYLSRISAVIGLLRAMDYDYPPLSAGTKDLLVRDIKKHLQKTAKLKPATLNSYLAAIDNFYGFLGLGKTSVSREDLPQEAPHALSPAEQKKFLRAIELTRRTKDQAIGSLLFYTGMRLSECAALELDDVSVVGRKTRAIIRSGKGGRYREIPLNSLVCKVMQKWLFERSEKYSGKSVSATIFLNPQGAPLLSNSIYEIIRKIGRDAGLEISPHTLRHTCLTALVRKQNDVVLVADIAGHKSLNTTKRYTLPSAADKAKALEQLLE